MRKHLSVNIDLLDEVSSQKIRRVEKGIGSFFTILLGSLRNHLVNDRTINEQRTIVRGSIELWIFLCDWKLYKNEHCLLTSCNIDDENCLILQDLLYLKILKFEFIKKVEVVIYFTDNYHLVLNRGKYYNYNDDMFQLNTENIVYSYNPQEGLLSEKKYSC